MAGKNSEKVRCSECGRPCAADSMKIVDGAAICCKCLYGDVEPVLIWPIGVVENERQRSPSGFTSTGGDLSTIRLYPGQKRFMTGLADETHLVILWQLHQSCSVKSLFARGRDGKRVGPFASRTPGRLTPIAITDVELVKVDGMELTVRGLDAVNGTPVLDIKVGMESLRHGGRQ